MALGIFSSSFWLSIRRILCVLLISTVPSALQLIREHDDLAKCEWFKLNNSVYNKDPRETNSQSKETEVLDELWNMGTNCFDSLFDRFNESAMSQAGLIY